MKIREASKDFSKGGIMLPSPKTYYMEANIQKDEETCDYVQEIVLKHPKCLQCALSVCHAPMRPTCVESES